MEISQTGAHCTTKSALARLWQHPLLSHFLLSLPLLSPFSCLVTASLILSFLLFFLNSPTIPPTLLCRYLPHPPTLVFLLRTSFYHLQPGSVSSVSRDQLLIFCKVPLIAKNSFHSVRVRFYRFSTVIAVKYVKARTFGESLQSKQFSVQSPFKYFTHYLMHSSAT